MTVERGPTATCTRPVTDAALPIAANARPAAMTIVAAPTAPMSFGAPMSVGAPMPAVPGVEAMPIGAMPGVATPSAVATRPDVGTGAVAARQGRLFSRGRWMLAAAFACGAAACGSSTATRTDFRPPTTEITFDAGSAVTAAFAIAHAIVESSAEVLVALTPEPAEPPYPVDVRSVRFTTTVVVRAEPSLRAAEVGVVRRGTRSAAVRAAEGDRECPRWIEIAPRGWACEKVLEPTGELPTQAAPATIAALEAADDGRVPLVPGLYGVVYGEAPQAFKSRDDIASGASRALEGATSIRAVGSVTIDGERYVQTSQGDLIAASSIAYISPSKFKGVAVTDRAKLPAWVRRRDKPRDPATVYAAPGGKRTGTIAPRTIVAIAELSDDGKFARIGDDRWIARGDLRAATVATPPEGTADDEKWFDVDLDEQVLVAYEGATPVYATLISSGKPLHDTPTIIARIGSKHETAHMVNNKPNERYSVADVPWTMYYDHNYALHTSYWHDGFGEVRSHGCINLAPRDARMLYRWSSPDVPPGWSSVHGDVDHPGSLVRVHSRRVTEPPFVGYARTLHDRDG